MPHNARRREVLRAVVDAAQQRRDGVLPMDVPGVEDTFADEVTLLAALQLRWHTQLAKRVEHAVDEVTPETPRATVDAVVAAWQETASRLAGLRAVLDRCATAPSSEAMAEVLEGAMAKEHAMLAMAAGLAGGHDDSAVVAGERLVHRARTERRTTRRTASRRTGNRRVPGVLKRITKAVRAA